jgi:alcohol dehydrogenase (cytochrome c)
LALDARTGAVLWKLNLGAPIVITPITFQVDGKQYVSVIDGHTRLAFGLRD